MALASSWVEPNEMTSVLLMATLRSSYWKTAVASSVTGHAPVGSGSPSPRVPPSAGLQLVRSARRRRAVLWRDLTRLRRLVLLLWRIQQVLTDPREGGGSNGARRLHRAVNGVVDAQAAEVGEAEQCLRAHDHGKIEPQLRQQLGVGRFEGIDKGGEGALDQPKADARSGPAGKIWLSNGGRDHGSDHRLAFSDTLQEEPSRKGHPLDGIVRCRHRSEGLGRGRPVLRKGLGQQ